MSGEFQFHDELASLFGQRAPPAAGAEMQQQQHSWFAEYLQAGGTQMVTDYDLLCRALDMPVVEDDDVKREQQQLAVDVSAAGGAALTQSGGGTAPLTPNTTSSLSSSSSEAGGGGGGGGGGGVAGAGEEDSMGRCKKEEGEEEEDGMAEDDGDKSKKGAAAKGGKAGKGEKRPRQPRFAFMTKSEVDHLEDGYRWRKYGQKAVKNSPYPRSYYRCTTQKCPVKKRVERSFQDPAVVITTYEGKHTHPIPSTLRGSTHLLAAHLQHHHAAGGHLAMPPPLGGAGAQYFGRHGGAIDVMSFLQPRANNHHAMPPTTMGLHASTHGMGGAGAIGSVAATAAGASPPSSLHQMQHFTPQDHFGLLQDMLPPFIHSNNQP